MIEVGYYKNIYKPGSDRIEIVKKEKQLDGFDIDKIVLNKPHRHLIINTKTFDYGLHLDFKAHCETKFNGPIACGHKTDIGLFLIKEIWEWPYWKKNNCLFLPGPNNPIGKHLIVLCDIYGDKIKTSIHQWQEAVYGPFQKGLHTAGCIRIPAKEIESLVKHLVPGQTVEII